MRKKADVGETVFRPHFSYTFSQKRKGITKMVLVSYLDISFLYPVVLGVVGGGVAYLLYWVFGR